MGGITGFTFPPGSREERLAGEGVRIRRMIASLRHRGSNGLSAMLLDGIALGHARLSGTGGDDQPLRDDATGVAIVLGGEVFNRLELREALIGSYTFRTLSSAETLLASFLDRGIDFVDQLNGQFAFAIHDPRDGSLWLGRDRFGICPLYYSRGPGGFAFASEAKALFAAGAISPRLDPLSLLETLHLWAPSEERSAFEEVRALGPGCVARLRGDELSIRRYWELDLSDERVDPGLDIDRATEELEGLLEDAVRLRLQGAGVGAYLSGGLDSSLLSALAQRQLGGSLETFAVAFAHERYDERAFQAAVAQALGSQHHSILVRNQDIGEILPSVVEHTETPLLRTAPAPLLKLSGLVREHGTRAVLSGEGADELFLGYDIFKETRIRQFWAKRPGSQIRPLLFGRLYPYLAISQQSPRMMRHFFGMGLGAPDALDFSHQVRWTNSGRITRFLSRGFLEALEGRDPISELVLRIPEPVRSWRPLARAQYLEIRTLLSQYLLSSQGERMLVANSVEGRFPFLDHRIAEYAFRLPDSLKLQGLKEKLILRRIAKGKVPAQVWSRQKFPYRAPIAEALVGVRAPLWAKELLARDAVESVGIFDGDKVGRLVAKLQEGSRPPSDADDMALAAVATTQLLAERFVGRRETPAGDLASVRGLTA